MLARCAVCWARWTEEDPLASGLRVYLACGITDMRNGMTGLAMLVQQPWPICASTHGYRWRAKSPSIRSTASNASVGSRPDPSNTEQSSEILGAAGATLTVHVRGEQNVIGRLFGPVTYTIAADEAPPPTLRVRAFE